MRASDTAGDRRAWVARVAATQQRQVLLPADTIAVARRLLSRPSAPANITRLTRDYQRHLDATSDALSVADRIEMVRRIGPVMPGQAAVHGGRTLTSVFTAALYHAAVDDLHAAMPADLAAEHDAIDALTTAVEDVCVSLGDDPTTLRVAKALAPTWAGSLADFTATVRAVI